MVEEKNNYWFLDKIPRIAHFYWGENTLSYMRYATLTTFIKHNPDWKVILWRTKFYPPSNEPFFSIGHDYWTECTDYVPMLKNLPIEIRDINVEQFGIPKNASEVHKSNVIIYHALSTEGGIWADMDILFFKPLDDLKVNTEANRNIETFVCIGYYGHSCGFYMACPNNKYFKSLLSLCPKEYNPKIYQCVAPNLCNKYYRTLESINALTPCVDIGMDAFYAHDAYHIDYIMQNNAPLFTEWSVGLHWYGGHKPWKTFIKATNGGLRDVPVSIIGNILKGVNAPNINIKDMKISIVMAYYNRQDLLSKTMESIRRTADKNYEVIIVDDGSDVPVVCEGAKILRIEKKDKTWTNPCIPYNMGFRIATGDIVIIQNPECYHIGDIISYVRTHIKTNTYLSFGCYAMNQGETDLFHGGVMPNLNNQIFSGTTRNGWYNHSLYRPKAYHFCSAILRQDLNMIGGFDERYASGISYDDDDFIRSIKMLGMDVRIIDAPHVIHQFHTLMAYDHPQMRMLHERNKKLYEDKYKPPPPTTKSSPRRKISALSRRQRDRQRKELGALLKKKRDEQQPL